MPQKSNIVGGQPSPGAAGLAGYEMIVDPDFNAIRTSVRPLDFTVGGQTLGHYSLAAVSGATTTLAAGTLLFAMKYGDTKSLMVLERISISAAITTAFTANQVLDVDAIAVRGWSTSDSAGNAIAIANNSNKTRTNMGASLVGVNGDVRIASATAVTAGGTKTPDTNAFAIGSLPGAMGATAAAFLGGTGPLELYSLAMAGQHPMVFGANEGFNLRFVTTQGAAGVVKYYVRVDWAEVAGY